MGLVFVVCVAFWLVLSGHYTPLYIGLGLVAAATVTWLNRRDEIVSDVVRALPGLARYTPWLLWQIVQSNVQVTRLVLDPRLPIDPVVVRIRTAMRGDLAVATFATVRDHLIAELVEVWADVGQDAPAGTRPVA